MGQNLTNRQSSIPYSLRLPIKLSQLIDQFAKKIDKSAPDAVRAGIESAFSNEYRILALDAANENRANTLRILRGAAAEAGSGIQLPMPIYSALMCFLHWAYLHAGDRGYANPRYTISILQIISDLMVYAKSDARAHACGCLGIGADDDFSAGIRRLQKDIKGGLRTLYAEMLSRPLEAMFDDLQDMDATAIAKIFAPHLRTLLPLAVKGARMGIDEDIVRRDMGSICPENVAFQIGDMKWWLQANTMSLVITEGHHTYVFGLDTVLTLYTAIECDALGDMVGPDPEPKLFTRGEFVLNRIGDHVVMHDNEGYRLGLSVRELRELIRHISEAFAQPAWQTLVVRYRELMGDL